MQVITATRHAGSHRVILRVVLSAMMLACCALVAPLAAEERVTFPSLDQRTSLVAWLFRPAQSAPRPALVLLHGCSGLMVKGGISGLYRAWANDLVDHGYVVLVVDSGTSRGFGQTCSAGPARRTMYLDRPKDAYGALAWLQAQPFVRPDRVGIMGWSQGGAIVLLSIAARSSGRPGGFAAPDFRVAVAFYPGACSERLQSYPFVDAAPQTWTTAIPLLVLQGEADTWTPAPPCRAFMTGAQARGAPVEFHLYPGAYHAFDAPNLARRELPNYRTDVGLVPIVATDPEARRDAFIRVPDFLRVHLED